MASFKQIGLLAAGSQPWNSSICDAKENRFAYCSTLAIYIYELDTSLNQFLLHSVMSEHKKTIKVIRWHPRDMDLIASAAADCQIIIWSVSQQLAEYRLRNLRGPVVDLDWCPYKNTIGFVLSGSPLLVWQIAEKQERSKLKESGFIRSPVSCLRWNPKIVNMIALGHDDGTLSILHPNDKAEKHLFNEELNSNNSETVYSVLQLDWDPHSAEYILMLNSNRRLRLLDPVNKIVITTFSLPNAASKIKRFSWINNAPGMFVTGDTNVGVLRVWSVSQSTSLLTLKVKDQGLHSIKVVIPNTNVDKSHHQENSSTISSTSESKGVENYVMKESNGAMPNCKVVCLFTDGGVGVYELRQRRWNFLKNMGHVETIFDCKFHPNDPTVLATGSFDGTIKLWSIPKMEPISSSNGNESIIYSISWSPGEDGHLAAATSKQGYFIWDSKSGVVLCRFLDHGSGSVFSVAWNPKDANCIASTGADSTCIVRHIDGGIIKKYVHGGAVYGCDWNPKNRDLLATGSEDRSVRIFCIATDSTSAIKVFEGHKAKVFNVKWSHLRDGILCSGSDDKTIRIWDYSRDGCLTVLEGHIEPVRGLMWHTELPHILISGSWDFSIKLWDIRTGYCLDTSFDHAADVYAISCHYERPFVIATCSRDSTVRIWHLEALQLPIYSQLICGHGVSSITSELSSKENITNHLIHGTYATYLKSLLKEKKINDVEQMFRVYSRIFLSPCGINNLWTLVDIVKNKSNVALPKNYGNGIMHKKHVVKYKGSVAQELETARLRGSSFGQSSKRNKLMQAAQLHMRLGEIERFCEIMVEIGEWDKALAVAPGVSLDYWRSLSLRRACFLLSVDDESAVPFLISTGNIPKLLEFYSRQGRYEDAFLVAQASNEGAIMSHGNSSEDKHPISNGQRGKCDLPKNDNSLINNVSHQLADWHLRQGQSVLGACSLLAVDDVKNSIGILLRGNELELAFSLSHIFPETEAHLKLTTSLLSRRFAAMKRYDLAVELLKSSKGMERSLKLICLQFNGTPNEINELYEKAELPKMANCNPMAERLCKDDRIIDAMLYHLLSDNPENGMDIGMNKLKGELSKENWMLDDVVEIVEIMSAVRKDILHSRRFTKYRHTLITVSAYIGAMLAIRRDYKSIVVPLMQLSCVSLSKEEVHLPIKLKVVKAELETYIIHTVLKSKQPSDVVQHPNDAQVSTWNTMLSRIGKEKYSWNSGPYIVTGSLLPSHMKKRTSVLDKSQIKGLSFTLEDGNSTMSLNDALMWARVNHFSPLGTPFEINPF